MTFNICLGREFEASGLTFCGGIGTTTHRQFSCQYRHVKGWAVAHLGTKRHGADDITAGERNNLIVVRWVPQHCIIMIANFRDFACNTLHFNLRARSSGWSTITPRCCGMDSGATTGHSVTRRVISITSASTRRRAVHLTLAACRPLTIATTCNTQTPRPLRRTRIAWARQRRESEGGGARLAELGTMIDGSPFSTQCCIYKREPLQWM
eukprot:COSAG02_NODE_7615_length_2932_cov_2.414755_4_plen_209_part_00